ncbi:OmpA family protein [Rhizobium sp. 'Codium 1']|uniref:OmpA family protein n=1 Tax=Rhizobium sp. 'Codium 1' TaxID=2940484 RepID=UPI001E55F957|nr:OmpA family protein [Rhizobium sp. 'Codium 1']MCC8933618.1 OmpA family protein [Rhizobium sp. 'Codium 1']
MFKNRLLATVAIPVLSVAVLAKPVAASVIGHPERQSQTRQAEEQLIQLAQAVVCNDGTEAPDADTCAARDAQAAAEEEQRRAAEAEAQAQAAAEAQRAAEAEAQAQAEAEAQRAAEAEAQAQAEAEAQRAAEAEAQAQAEAEAQRAAEAEAQAQAEAEAQRAAEAEAQAQAEADAQRAAEAEAQAQAEAEAQRAAEAEAQAQAEADAQRAAEAEAQAQAEAEAQRAAEAEAQQKAEEAQPAAEPQDVTCADGSQAATEAECPAPVTEQPTEEQQPAPEEAAPQPTGEQAPAAEEELRPGQDAAGEQPATEGEVPADQAEQPAGQQPADQQATGNDVPAGAQPEGEQVVVPAVEPQEDQPVQEITDTRTTEEKQAIAEDPSQSSETVVLPVDNGAAVLDSDKDADNSGGQEVRQQRSELRAQEEAAPPPENDAAAQADSIKVDQQAMQANITEQGTTLEAAPTFEVPTTVTNNVSNSTVTTNVTNNVTNNNIVQNNVVNQVTEIRVIEQVDNRTVINVGNQIVVRSDDRERLRYDAEQTYYEELPRGRTRETIERADGSKLVTVYNRYGDIIIRSRISPRGREYVLMYSPEAEGERPTMYVDVGLSLPPMRLTIPVNDYIVSTTRSPDRDYYEFLGQPPVERVERVYSIDEVKSSARIRDKVRRIDLDTITFPSGSAEVPLEQARTLRKVAEAMEKLLENDPGEVFLIEGHTDAVGSDRSNLVLSDQRAETVANLLTEVYGIPPENMSVQGYGERFLKIRTEAAEQQNRRVAIRRVTTLVRPAGISSND